MEARPARVPAQGFGPRNKTNKALACAIDRGKEKDPPPEGFLLRFYTEPPRSPSPRLGCCAKIRSPNALPDFSKFQNPTNPKTKYFFLPSAFCCTDGIQQQQKLAMRRNRSSTSGPTRNDDVREALLKSLNTIPDGMSILCNSMSVILDRLDKVERTVKRVVKMDSSR